MKVFLIPLFITWKKETDCKCSMADSWLKQEKKKKRFNKKDKGQLKGQRC